VIGTLKTKFVLESLPREAHCICREYLGACVSKQTAYTEAGHSFREENVLKIQDFIAIAKGFVRKAATVP
jgi:hypothetical protein